ncbi:MAG: PQQ-binding-like beta-propeller repeat protein [Acidobacteriota bacterium]|nr:PQQ-binding-like beta-propeller repeat protein [Acidobacteriota bacterium]
MPAVWKILSHFVLVWGAQWLGFVFLVASVWASPAAVAAEAAEDGWPQWGGVPRNFTVGVDGGESPVAVVWSADGPRELWRRDLGPGYSSLVFGGGRLFTLFREGESETVVAVASTSGETLWAFTYPAPPGPGRARGHGKGPHSTPLLAQIDGRRLLIAVGSNGAVYALDPADGALLWSFDLGAASGSTRFGHAASPLQVEDTVVLLAGGSEPRAVALSI